MIEIVADPGTDQEITVGGGDQPLSGVLPVLPLRDTVPVPDTMIPLAIGQERSIKLVDDVLAGDRRLVMVASREPELDTPGPEQLYEVGVVGQIARMLKVPDGTLRLLVQAGARVRVGPYEQTTPYLAAQIEEAPDTGVSDPPTPELTALQRNVQETFSRIVEAVPYLPEELQLAVANIEDAVALSHLIAGSLRLSSAEKQALLEETDLSARLRRLVEILARELEVISIGSEIQSQVQSELEKGQREYVLRQQLKAIQEELGESDPVEAEVADLRDQLDALELPEAVATQADRELRRLESIPQASAEHGVIRNYLEWIVSLPWNDRTVDDLDLTHARSVLDADHFGLDPIKERILEFLAVRQLKPDARGSILCFVGPPGVGKTSLGKSIARAMGRNFERISAGGVRDEAEIRGHRRTYIGAMPGTIVRALRDAGSSNPLLMIDEIDKMGSDYRGDPSSAMLEVLDPEQNATFRDHYLDVPFDLSRVMFITTANTLDTIPGPLRDRMEVIQLAGYTAQEKLEIAKRYLVPRQLDRHGLRRSTLRFGDPALRTLIEDYTREAGVRNLEREIGRAVRKIAREIVEGEQEDAAPAAANGRPRRVTVSRDRVVELLGRGPFDRSGQERRKRTSRPGVATGLAWTPVGGDVLYVEAAAMPTTRAPQVTITGQLGEVMTESVRAALTWVRGHGTVVSPELPDDWFGTHDLHVHVPAGATPKDGPSAGITIATALCSLVSGRAVRSDVAMTGEITLTGEVLPIGGLKEKALAAQRAGIGCVIAPRDNERDAEDVPEPLRRKIAFHWVDRVEEVLELALEPAGD
ncbi:endopeptidase La [Patulibacter brassicae]|uniref:Lon protease n=1 Tax=Patulibacter brassicae TaxID=1705717 RepID=A0ABU4VH84_9ACTN|nr:endopeptidase La [Patulibacter brassicae]MDX8151180.1 endopeptidase La [Patulibacter brassicae]